jgi:hypothetical protein
VIANLLPDKAAERRLCCLPPTRRSIGVAMTMSARMTIAWKDLRSTVASSSRRKLGSMLSKHCIPAFAGMTIFSGIP